jgi:DNA invertase Pin-like site-specific DNA recombinase
MLVYRRTNKGRRTRSPARRQRWSRSPARSNSKCQRNGSSDDGYSGANLIRPGLERVRDLAAEGLIQAVLIYAPDRLSRRYAHQILLVEELARAGVETLFVRTPRGSTPEDELLVQFQGMIAEYERAQILERSRRGKRHRARQGEVSVLSGAPFGYRFIRKTDHSAAYYQVDEEQARIVRWMFELYTVQGLSACFAGPHSPWSPPFAPPAPLRIAPPQRAGPLCSPASQLLWRGPTSRVRSSSATVPHLPDAGRQRQRRSGQTRDLPASDAILLHVMWP